MSLDLVLVTPTVPKYMDDVVRVAARQMGMTPAQFYQEAVREFLRPLNPETPAPAKTPAL